VSNVYRPGWRTQPWIVWLLAGAFIAAYALFAMQPDTVQNQLVYTFAVIPVRFDAQSPDHFAAWYEALLPFFGHVFLHGGWLHVGVNTLVFMQGAPFVAWRMGTPRFLVLFFLSAIGSAAGFILLNLHDQTPAVGASGAICGVFAAYFLSVRNSWREALGDPQVRNAAIMFLVINVGLAGVASASGVLPIAWQAHLGGFIAGGLSYLAFGPRPYVGPWSQVRARSVQDDGPRLGGP
jgi:membrane associated rhomboid family serine protease